MLRKKNFLETSNQCVVVYLTPGETASVDVKFTPREIGKYEGLVRLFVADNPYENLMIDLKAEAYAELIVLEGLELVNAKSTVVNERRESNSRPNWRPLSPPGNELEGGKAYNRDIKRDTRLINSDYKSFSTVV